MRVNRPDGTVRDEVVIVGESGQAVGMNGDRLKVDANLNVDEVTVSNVGITSVDGAGMEQAGEYMPVKGDVRLTGSYVEYDVAVSIWIPVGSGQRRIVGQNDRAWSTASSGAGFLPIPLEGVEKLCLSLINPSTEGTFGNFRLAFYDTLTPSRTESGAVNHIPLDINVPASGRLLLDLTPYLYAFKGLGLIYHAQSSSETAEYTFRFRAWKR